MPGAVGVLASSVVDQWTPTLMPNVASWYDAAHPGAIEQAPIGPGFIYLPGILENYLSTPNVAGFNITNSTMCVVARIRTNQATWANALPQIIAAKFDSLTNGSWAFRLLNTGALSFANVYTTTASTSILSTVTLTAPAGEWLWVAVAYTGVTTKLARFYTSPDGVTWTKLGADVTPGANSAILNGTSPIWIGQYKAGPTTSHPFNGDIQHVSVRNGVGAGNTVGGTEVFKFDGNELTNAAATSFTSTSGHVMTVNKTAAPMLEITPKVTALGASAGRWLDRSANARHLSYKGIPPSHVTNFLNGKPVVFFGGDGSLSRPVFNTSLTDFMVAAVVYQTTGSQKRVYFTTGQNSHLGCTLASGGAGWWGWHIGGVAWGDASPPKLNVWDQQTVYRSTALGHVAARSKGVKLGGEQTNGFVAPQWRAWMGGDPWNKLTCYIAELLVIDGAWTDADRAKLENYLMSKWAVA